MNPDDLSRAFQQTAPAAPSPSGWLGAARRRRRRSQAMLGAVAAVATVAVVVPLAINLGGSAPTVIASPAPPAKTMSTMPGNNTSGTSAVSPTASPESAISEAAMQVSYEQEALLAAHPEIFSGFGFADDNQVAVLFYKRSEEAKAKQLAAALAGNPASRLEARRNSWADLIRQRHAVRDAALSAGVTVVDSAPDLQADGVVLIVPADQVDADGGLRVGASENLTKNLRDLGMVGVEADPRTGPAEIAGFKLRNQLPGGRFRGLPSKAANLTGDQLSGLLERYPGVFVEVGLGRWGDDVDLWFKESRRADVDRLLGEADVDVSIVNLIPSRLSFQELEAMTQAAVLKMQTLPPAGKITSLGPSAEFGGLIIGLANPLELEQLTPQERQSLRTAGVVAVEEGGGGFILDTPGSDGVLAQKPITQPTVAPTEQ